MCTNGRGKSFSNGGSFRKTSEIQVHLKEEVWLLTGSCITVLIMLVLECYLYGLI